MFNLDKLGGGGDGGVGRRRGEKNKTTCGLEVEVSCKNLKGRNYQKNDWGE